MNMKHITSFTAICLILSLAACSKKDKVQSKTEILTTGSWRLTASETDNDGNGTYEVNEYSSFLPCFTDNFFTFNVSGQVISDEGLTKCDPMDSQTETTTWQFTNNETNLVVDGDSYEIKELSNTTLRLKLPFAGGRSSQVIFTKR
jgi:hypothetical protein